MHDVVDPNCGRCFEVWAAREVNELKRIQVRQGTA